MEKEMATHSSIHAWKIPWTDEPGGLQSMGSQRVGHDWATSVCVFRNVRKEASPTAGPLALRCIISSHVFFLIPSSTLAELCQWVTKRDCWFNWFLKKKLVRSFRYYGDQTTDLLVFSIFLLPLLACQQTNSPSPCDIDLQAFLSVGTLLLTCFPGYLCVHLVLPWVTFFPLALARFHIAVSNISAACFQYIL